MIKVYCDWIICYIVYDFRYFVVVWLCKCDDGVGFNGYIIIEMIVIYMMNVVGVWLFKCVIWV